MEKFKARIEAAKALARAVLGDDTELGAEPAGLSFAELWQGYWREFARHQKSERDKKRIGGVLLRFFGDKTAQAITIALCEDYRDQRKTRSTRLGGGLKPASINRELAVLRHCLNWGVRQRLLEFNPLSSLKMELENNTRRTKISNEGELQGILAELDDYHRAYILLLIDCGLRRTEAAGLRWRQLDRRRRLLLLEETKNGEQRRPRLSARAFEAICAIPPVKGNPFIFATRSFRKCDVGKHMDGMTMLRKLQAAADRSGFEPAEGERINLHSLRHGFAYLRRVRDKIPEKTVMLQGGWKTRAAFDRYGIGDDLETEEMYRVVDANIAEELKKLRK